MHTTNEQRSNRFFSLILLFSQTKKEKKKAIRVNLELRRKKKEEAFFSAYTPTNTHTQPVRFVIV